MAFDDRVLGGVHRLAHLLQREAGTSEDRGPADDTDLLWPVDEEFSLAGATEWLGSPPLTGAVLRGRVVLVNFWTFTCINWLRQVPHVRAWAQAYGDRGLVVVGVHSPEFSFEHDVEQVRRAAQDRSLGYPVAVDNHLAVWRSFHNHFWPALYLVDAEGRLRHHGSGEGGYAETETVIRDLLTEAGAGDLPPAPAPVDARDVEAPADWATLRSAETYLGYDRTYGFASSPAMVPDRSRHYTAPRHLGFGHWALSGSWTAGRETTSSDGTGGRLSCRFQARDLHLVLSPGASRAGTGRFSVLLDGRPPGIHHGVDVDDEGHGTIAGPRLYQLVRRQGAVTESTVEIQFLDPGVHVYAFTFG
jgi:thiol-disulfide isomerase/thioredoxin